MIPRSPHGPSRAAVLRGERGVTLTELMAVAAILSVVLAALIPVFSLGGQTWGRMDKHSEMVQNDRRAMDKFVRELRAARSFQLITPALVRFTVAVGDGSGATPTVEYQLNGATGDLDYRISADFNYRRRLTVTAGASAVPAGYSVAVTFDHAALVTAGKSLSSGDDVRIRYWTGTQWVELDRFKDPPTAWNTSTTRIWFKLQAAIAANGSNNNYYLYYGDLQASPPPANGDYVFLDYEDGTSLANWIRRDSCTGTYSTSAGGFLFSTGGGSSCYRELSKNVSHSDVEIFWGFRSDSPSVNSNRHQVGMSARRSDAGVGYLVTPADVTNSRLRIRSVADWSSSGSVIGDTPASITLGTDYYGRFSLIGSSLMTKYWAVGTAEPGWMLTITDSTVASGLHYGQVDGFATPETHTHSTLIVRQSLTSEPTTALSTEESGARVDAFASLAGPFRAMTVQCYDAAGSSVSCATPAAVKSVQISLAAMDPTGEVADVVVTSRAYRQAP